MITKLETARNLARAFWSDPDAVFFGLKQFTDAITQQGNTVTNTGSVMIGNRFYKISNIWSETRPGEKHEFSK